ncbi:M1 family metallopeptidase [Lewinella sp. W8]|uniref:M1 family metallopeptidase n=1 Tax=Lewinella sp. W8 TaxID=2528208 RepID=UPI0010671A6B|nr:M1 family metallopeptidase [Lewinella sp. W8]MTB51616.1 hypothetical protein [Lewinella sp. W8]
MRTLLIFLFLTANLYAQNDDYFQQKVAYAIQAELDDERHLLHAQLDLTYENNSPDTLRQIAFHCWPRAYASDETALAAQLLRQGNTDFHFAPPSARGNLDSLSFTANGRPAEHATDETHRDIVWVALPEPLLPGTSIALSTPFRVKIPESFSRLGHVETSYQMTQWYPKPAVYDRDGWHAMPYLDRGEFYGEFGSFDVSITLPRNYRVAATGTLETAAERQWLRELAVADRRDLAVRQDLEDYFLYEAFPASEREQKTIRYSAENVHDFAWFADKRFKVLHDTLQLTERAGAVDVWSFFTETEAAYWKNSLTYLKRATRFYSDHIGVYPYPQVTGVQSALSAGGGMEYPMITVIGLNDTEKDLDQVLAHEVGHNWFYGILGSNERDHPWMDEGLNSYYEWRYLREYYPEEEGDLDFLGQPVDFHRLGYRYMALLGRDLAPDTRSDSLVDMHYWIAAYSKPALALQEIAAYTGEHALDEAMRFYYATWKFRHPGPEDFFRTLEGTLSPALGRAFRDAMATRKISDWNVADWTPGDPSTARFWQLGDRMAPATAQLILAEKGAGSTVTVDPQEQYLAEDLPLSLGVELPAALNPLDLYLHNNRQGNNALRLSLLTAPERPGGRQLFVTPLLGYNATDRVMLGAGLHNRTLEPKRLEWALAPMYSFASDALVGFAGLRWRLREPFPFARQLMLSAGTQGFHDFSFAEENYHYTRAALRAELTFRDHPLTERHRQLSFQLINLSRFRPRFGNSGNLIGTDRRENQFFRLAYAQRKDREINSRSWTIRLEYKTEDSRRDSPLETAHLRLDTEWSGGYQYEPERFFRWRFYGGYFLDNDLRERASYPNTALSLVDNASSDYAADGLFLGRGGTGIYAQQLETRQGGFRAPIAPAFTFGRSNDYLLAVNLDATLPFQPERFPFGVFLDAGTYGFRPTSSEPARGEFRWVGGLSVTVLDGRIGAYLPLVSDPDTRLLLEQRGGLSERISFRISLADWLPWKWMDEVF